MNYTAIARYEVNPPETWLDGRCVMEEKGFDIPEIVA